MKNAYKVASHISWRRVDDEIVVLDLNTSVYYTFNDVAARIWELLAESRPVESVASALAEEYDADVASIGKDVKEFLKEVDAERLLEPLG